MVNNARLMCYVNEEDAQIAMRDLSQQIPSHSPSRAAAERN